MSHQACPKLVLAVTLLLGLAAIQVNSLDCVQCSSKTPECNIVGRIPPTRCHERSYYCVVTMVLRPDGWEVIWGCSPKKQSGCLSGTNNNKTTHICFISCDWDGCNGPRRKTL